MKPQLFRKRPVVIEAKLWDGTGSCLDALRDWGAPIETAGLNTKHGLLVVTKEGPLFAPVGYWIIRGVQDEFYPIDPEIFAATYEPVEEP